MKNTLLLSNKIQALMIFFLSIFLSILIISYSGKAELTGQPGDHCGNPQDPPCRSDLVCLYNRCLAQPFASCNSSFDCAGEATNLMGCFNGQCLGRHGYPCGNPPNNDICAPGFYCHISEPWGYNFCVASEDPSPSPTVNPPIVVTKPAIYTY